MSNVVKIILVFVVSFKLAQSSRVAGNLFICLTQSDISNILSLYIPDKSNRLSGNNTK
jgi:hypothetical protein